MAEMTPLYGYQEGRNPNIIKRFSFPSISECSSVFMKDDDNVQVCARLKPLPENQMASSYRKINRNTLCYTKYNFEGQQDTCYKFSHVFDADVSQQTIYKQIIEPKVEKFLRGGNVLIFSYGTTGSGKSHTIQGTAADPGIVPRSLLQIFKSLYENIEEITLCPNKSSSLTKLSDEKLSSMSMAKEKMLNSSHGFKFEKDNAELNKCLDNDYIVNLLVSLDEDTTCLNAESIETKYSLWVSFVEVYNENIYDLLDTSNDEGLQKPLRIGYDVGMENYIKDINYYLVTTWTEAWKIYIYGRNKLHMTATRYNHSSSRSHSIFDLRLVKTNSQGSVCNSFTICDLAGSERQKKVQHQGFRLRETININTSLMVLNRCFNIIRENQMKTIKRLVPYRDSKLTQIFKKSLLSSNGIVMIINISQSNELLEDTEQVLRISSIAREIILKKPKKCYRNPAKKFSIFCSAPPGVSAERILFEDKQKEEGGFQDDPKVLRDLIANLEAQLKDKDVFYQRKIDDLQDQLKQAEESINSSHISVIDESQISEVPMSSFLELKKRKRKHGDSVSMCENYNYSKILEKLNETREHLSKKSEECNTLRTEITSLQYKLSMISKNTAVEELIKKLENQDAVGALQDMFNEKRTFENKNKILGGLLEEAKRELLYFEEKLNETEAQLNEKVVENQDLKSENNDKDEQLLKYSEVIAQLDKEHEEEKTVMLKQIEELRKQNEQLKEQLEEKNHYEQAEDQSNKQNTQMKEQLEEKEHTLVEDLQNEKIDDLLKSVKKSKRRSKSLSPPLKTPFERRKLTLRKKSPSNAKTPAKGKTPAKLFDSSDDEYLPKILKSTKKTARKKKLASEYVEDIPDDNACSSNYLQVPGVRVTRSTSNRRLFSADVDEVSEDMLDLNISSPKCSPSREIKRHQQ